jgi:hypothetical protein
MHGVVIFLVNCLAGTCLSAKLSARNQLDPTSHVEHVNKATNTVHNNLTAR